MVVTRIVGPGALAVLVTLVGLMPAPAEPPAAEPAGKGTVLPDDAVAIMPYRTRLYPDHAPDVIKQLVDDAITTQLAQCGGRLLPYYLPDLVQYVDDDVERLLKFLKKLKSEDPGRVKSEVEDRVPEYTELGRLLRAEPTSTKKWAVLDQKTVVFLTSALTDENIVAVLSALEPIRDQIRKIDLSYSAVKGRCWITESALDAMKKNGVQTGVIEKLTRLVGKNISQQELNAELPKPSPSKPPTESENTTIYYANVFSNGILYLLSFPSLTDIDFSGVSLNEGAGEALNRVLSIAPLISLPVPSVRLLSPSQGPLSFRIPPFAQTPLSPIARPTWTPQIRRLWLRGATIAQGDLLELLNGSERLEVLSLADLTVTWDRVTGPPTEAEKVPVGNWVRDFAGASLSGLKSLSLAKNGLTDHYLKLSDLNRLKRLESLDLADNPDITDNGLFLLEHGKTPVYAKLKELSLSGTGRPRDGKGAVTDAGVRQLLTWNRKTLTSLNLSGTATLAGPKSPSLDAIRQMECLAALNLAGTGITDDGLRAIWRGPDRRAAKWLGLALSATWGGDNWAELLSGVLADGHRDNWAELLLEIFRNRAGGRGDKRAELFSWVFWGGNVNGLISLDLSNTRVTDAGLIDGKEAVGFPQLKTIRIGAADLWITAGGVSRRNALVAAQFSFSNNSRYPNFNLAKLVKPTQ